MYLRLGDSMYAALNQNQHLIYADSGLTSERYYCPKCYLPVKLVLKTAQHRPYFRHYSRASDHDGETALHFQGKTSLQQALQQLGVVAKQEVTLGTDERRADVLWCYQEQYYAFEFQCAMLSVNELTHRHLSYQALQVTDIWLLGQTYLDQNTACFKRTALKFICYRQRWGYFIAIWLPQLAMVRVFHHLAFVPPRHKVVFKRTDYTLDAFLQGYLQMIQSLVTLPQMALNFDPSNWLRQQLYFQQSQWLALQTRCYQRGLNLMNLPQELWLPQRLPPLSSSWSKVLSKQIELFLATGALSWDQRSQLYLATKWPLVN